MESSRRSEPEEPSSFRAVPYRPALGLRVSQRSIRLLGGKTVFVLALAALIGIGGGYGAIAFRWLIEHVNRLAYPGGSGLAALAELPWYVLVLVPAIGGLVVGPLIYVFAREAKGHGVPEVMDAVANKGGLIRARVAVVKSLASALSIGVGASVGREGPIVQIGSSLGSTLGQLLHLDGRTLRLLIGCGAAAGIAATFNAPLAGAVFSMEVILGAGTARTFTPLVVSAVAATAVARHHLGDIPAFDVPTYELVSAWELALYVLLGCIAGLVAVGFSRGLYLVEDLWDRIPIPEWLKPCLGGLFIGGAAVALPHVTGNGYESIEAALGAGSAGGVGLMGILFLMGLVVGKILATHVSLGAGFSGGVFAPSLFLGAVLGCAFGAAANAALPEGMVAPAGAYALVAMGAVVAAGTHAPLTAILIVFEMTGNYRIIVPLMLTCLIASVLSVKLSRESIYTLKLARRGQRLGRPGQHEVMHTTRVEEIVRPADSVVGPELPLPDVGRAVLRAGGAPTYVVDRAGRLLGFVSLNDIAPVLHEMDGLRDIVIAADVMRPAHGSVRPEDTVARVLGQLTRRDLELGPVVDRDGVLLGTVSRRDILAHYEREVLSNDTEALSFLEEPGSVGAAPVADSIKVATGETVDTIPVTAAVAGRSLRGLDLRASFGVQVMGLRGRSDSDVRVLDPSEPLEPGGSLVVVGPASAIADTRRALA